MYVKYRLTTKGLTVVNGLTVRGRIACGTDGACVIASQQCAWPVRDSSLAVRSKIPE